MKALILRSLIICICLNMLIVGCIFHQYWREYLTITDLVQFHFNENRSKNLWMSVFRLTLNLTEEILFSLSKIFNKFLKSILRTVEKIYEYRWSVWHRLSYLINCIANNFNEVDDFNDYILTGVWKRKIKDPGNCWRNRLRLLW